MVDRSFREFSEGQIEVITATVWLYRGEGERYFDFMSKRLDESYRRACSVKEVVSNINSPLQVLINPLQELISLFQLQEEITDKQPVIDLRNMLTEFLELENSLHDQCDALHIAISTIRPFHLERNSRSRQADQEKYTNSFWSSAADIPNLQKSINKSLKLIEKVLKVVRSKSFSACVGKDTHKQFRDAKKSVETIFRIVNSKIDGFLDVYQQIETLQNYFPQGKFSDVPGFCKSVSRVEIAGKENSLSPEQYVGVAPAKPVENSKVTMLRESIETWNHWRQRNRGARQDLTGTDLSNLYLSEVDLSNTVLDNANLENSDLSFSSLQGASIRSANLRKANLEKANLKGAVLLSANLQKARLNGADLSSTDLSGALLAGANLTNANLSEARVLRADLRQTTLTGACIADWHISETTILSKIKCTHVFRELDKNDKFKARLPQDKESSFRKDEFVQRYQILQSASETIDLTFTDGVNWQAFFESFQAVYSDHPLDEISIRSMERKGNTLVIRIETGAAVDRAAVETELKQHYQFRLTFIEAHYQELLKLQGVQLEEAEQAIKEEKREKSSLIGIMKTMAEKQGSKYEFNGPVGNVVDQAQSGSRFHTVLHNYPPEQRQNLAGAAQEIQALLNQLTESYPIAEVPSRAIEQLDQNPQMKDRVVGALKAGGKAAIEKLVDNPAVGIVLAIVEGAMNPG